MCLGNPIAVEIRRATRLLEPVLIRRVHICVGRKWHPRWETAIVHSLRESVNFIGDLQEVGGEFMAEPSVHTGGVLGNGGLPSDLKQRLAGQCKRRQPTRSLPGARLRRPNTTGSMTQWNVGSLVHGMGKSFSPEITGIDASDVPKSLRDRDGDNVVLKVRCQSPPFPGIRYGICTPAP